MGKSSISMGHFPPLSMAMLNNQRVETNNSTSVKRRPSRCNQNLHGFRGFTMIFASIETKQQHEGDRYPLVMTNIPNWKDPPFSMGQFTISMVSFHSYVMLC